MFGQIKMEFHPRIRESQFPDTGVIVPYSFRANPMHFCVELTPCQCYTGPGRRISEDEFENFPAFFPVSREFGPENGSLETQPSAIESLKSVVYRRDSNFRHPSGQIRAIRPSIRPRENSPLRKYAQIGRRFFSLAIAGSLRTIGLLS